MRARFTRTVTPDGMITQWTVSGVDGRIVRLNRHHQYEVWRCGSIVTQATTLLAAKSILTEDGDLR